MRKNDALLDYLGSLAQSSKISEKFLVIFKMKKKLNKFLEKLLDKFFNVYYNTFSKTLSIIKPILISQTHCKMN